MKIILTEPALSFIKNPIYQDLEKFIIEKDGKFFLTCDFEKTEIPAIHKVAILLKC